MERNKSQSTAWTGYDQYWETRYNEKGEFEYREHTYADWTSETNTTESRTCKVCNYKMTRNKDQSTAWVDCDDNWEVRYNEKGEFEYREHTYGNWSSISDTKEERTCSYCKHKMQRNKDQSTAWVDCDDNWEVRYNEKGEFEYRAHTYGNWSSISDTKEERTCSYCKHKMQRNKDQSTPWVSHDDNWETRYNEKGEFEYRAHTYGDWKSESETKESRTCSVCKHKMTRDKHVHSYDTSYKYVNNGDTTHILHTLYDCKDCDYEYETTETKNCTFGDWYYNEYTDLYEHACKECGHVMEKPKTLTLGK